MASDGRGTDTPARPSGSREAHPPVLGWDLRFAAVMPDEKVELAKTGRQGNPVWGTGKASGRWAFLETRHSHHGNMVERMEPCGVCIEIGRTATGGSPR